MFPTTLFCDVLVSLSLAPLDYDYDYYGYGDYQGGYSDPYYDDYYRYEDYYYPPEFSGHGGGPGASMGGGARYKGMPVRLTTLDAR